MAEYSASLMIIGSGPAGYSAAIYAARAGIDTFIVSGEQLGGQLIYADNIENYPGFDTPVSGLELMQKMQKQAINLGVKIIKDTIQEVDFDISPFVCNSNTNSFSAKSIIISTGASAKWLGLKNEHLLIGKGVSTCAICDGWFYKNKDVVVVGGGNTAAKEALYLSDIANSVTIVHRRNNLRADNSEQTKLFNNNKIKIEWDSVVEEFITQKNPFKLKEILIKNLKNDKTKKIKTDGVFIAIGYSPNTTIFKKYLNIDENGYIITKPGCCETNVTGIFVA